MKIFLSAVSAQFRDCRQALASDLRAVGCEVKVQEDFQQHGGTLLEKLQNYIADCDRIIALMGSTYGAEPDVARLSNGMPRRSYTQWEYYFAMGERLSGVRQPPKDVFVYLASPEYLATFPVSQPADQERLQTEFLEALKSSCKDRNQFGSLLELCRLVLRDGFKVRERAPLHNLPVSLGPFFKGRETDLARLERQLESHGKTVKCHAICGTGGIGKSRLAIEYGWQHEAQYHALLLVRADSPENLRTGLADLRAVLQLEKQRAAAASAAAAGPAQADGPRPAPQASPDRPEPGVQPGDRDSGGADDTGPGDR